MPNSPTPSTDSTAARPRHAAEQHRKHSELLHEHQLTPMEAANVLYAVESAGGVPEAIVGSLSRQIFDSEHLQPSGRLRRLLARLTLRYLKRTTRSETREEEDGSETTIFRNRLLERSGHPYAMTLLEPSDSDSAAFVEGGDPMNAPYMMILPEVRQNACRWDKLFLDSVVGRDVQLRFIWETRMTHEMAAKRLKRGEPVHLKAAAAGTGLSLILVYDRLIRDGYDPELITATITDRESANVAKTGRLLASLPTTRDFVGSELSGSGIVARVEDLLDPMDAAGTSGGADSESPHLVMTLVGILEYFHGFTSATTEEHLGISKSGHEADAEELLQKVAMTFPGSGNLIVNSYRVGHGARILDVFGKRMRYRTREDLQALLGSAGFVPTGVVESGNVYDVEVFEKKAS